MADPFRNLLKILVYPHNAAVDSLTEAQVFQLLSAAVCLTIIFIFIAKSYFIDCTACWFEHGINALLLLGRGIEQHELSFYILAVTTLAIGVYVSWYLSNVGVEVSERSRRCDERYSPAQPVHDASEK
jgi:hypothetical protein